MPGIIYEITNCVNGKRYIGLTRYTAQKRWKEHVISASRDPKSSIHRAISKYGVNNFNVKEIASCLSFDFLSELERIVISQERPEYNQTNGGEVTLGRKYTDETKEIIRQKNTGKKRSEKARKRISEVKLQQYKENAELAIKATKHLRENRARWEEKRKEGVRLAMTGRKMPDEHRERLREISKARIRGPEERAKIAESRTKKVRCETDDKIYASRHEAARFYGVSEKTIWRACNGKCGPVKGHIFSYVRKNQ